MRIIDRLKQECTEPVEMWGGDVVPPLQADKAYDCYRILQWDDIKRDYVEWISTFSAYDTLLRYFRGKCFEQELLDCDDIDKQVGDFVTLVANGDLHR